MNLEECNTQKRQTPVAKPLLNNDLQIKPRIKPCDYRSIIVMLTCLQGIYRPEISMEVHQCARYSREPMLSHERSMTRIGRHLLDATGRGLTCKVDKSKGFE